MNRTLATTLGLALMLAWGALSQDTVPASSGGAENKSVAPATKTEKGYPFRGKLKSIDRNAMTFTLAGKEKDRVFQVTSETKFVRDGKTATLAQGVEGEEVGGYARNLEGGKIQALTVRFGAAASAPAKAGSASKSARSSADKGTN